MSTLVGDRSSHDGGAVECRLQRYKIDSQKPKELKKEYKHVQIWIFPFQRVRRSTQNGVQYRYTLYNKHTYVRVLCTCTLF